MSQKKSPELIDERQFLHKIATPMATMRLLTKKLSAQLDGSRPDGSQEQMMATLGKILHALSELENLHAQQKEHNYIRDQAS